MSVTGGTCSFPRHMTMQRTCYSQWFTRSKPTWAVGRGRSRGRGRGRGRGRDRDRGRGRGRGRDRAWLLLSMVHVMPGQAYLGEGMHAYSP